jgi:alkaline phosphatase D
VITGDSHNNWVRNVPPDSERFDAPPVATEFMGTSISTGGDEKAFIRSGAPQNPHVLMRNNNRGYVRCTLTADAWTSEFRVVGTVRRPDSPCSTLATFAVENGRAGAQRVGV